MEVAEILLGNNCPKCAYRVVEEVVHLPFFPLLYMQLLMSTI